MIHEIEPDYYDPAYDGNRKAELTDFALAYKGNQVLAYVENGLVRLPRFETLAELVGAEKRDELLNNAYYLFSISGTPYFLAEVDLSGTREMKSKEELFEAMNDRELGAASEKRFFIMNINRFRELLPKQEAIPGEDFHGKRSESVSMIFAAATGGHFAWWKNSRKYCGCCGALTEPSKTERAMVCPACGSTEYPKISPAIIVAIIKKGENGSGSRPQTCGWRTNKVTESDGRGISNAQAAPAAVSAQSNWADTDRLLLVRNKTGPYKKLALVAGFVEIGESFEQAVHREVMEEVGLKVKNLRYYKNQPWGLTYAQMIGFIAELDGDDTITLQESELSEAGWYLREEIPEAGFRLSVGNEMLHEFKMGRIG